MGGQRLAQDVRTETSTVVDSLCCIPKTLWNIGPEISAARFASHGYGIFHHDCGVEAGD